MTQRRVAIQRDAGRRQRGLREGGLPEKHEQSTIVSGITRKRMASLPGFSEVEQLHGSIQKPLFHRDTDDQMSCFKSIQHISQ